MWRYRRHGEHGLIDGGPARLELFAGLWDVLGAVSVPVLLVRGMRPQSVVDDADEAELLRRLRVRSHNLAVHASSPGQ